MKLYDALTVRTNQGCLFDEYSLVVLLKQGGKRLRSWLIVGKSELWYIELLTDRDWKMDMLKAAIAHNIPYPMREMLFDYWESPDWMLLTLEEFLEYNKRDLSHDIV